MIPANDRKNEEGWVPVAAKTISINRAPVLTLWAAVVAQRLGFDEDEALTLGKAVAGLNAYSKGRRLGMFKPPRRRRRRHGKGGRQMVIDRGLGSAIQSLL
jgi:hypothetical protein